MNSARCAFCNRLTLKPAAFIGPLPVGPTCARKHALTELIMAGGRGSVRKAETTPHHASTARRDARTMDLFEAAAA